MGFVQSELALDAALDMPAVISEVNAQALAGDQVRDPVLQFEPFLAAHRVRTASGVGGAAGVIPRGTDPADHRWFLKVIGVMVR